MTILPEEEKTTSSEINQESSLAKEIPEPEILAPLTIIEKRCSFQHNNEEVQDILLLKVCLKCKQLFCPMHSARFSPNFCQDCFKNLTVILDKYIRSTEDYDSITDQLVTRKESCNRLQIDGPDYVFYTKWIHKLNDDELKSVFEFHYFIVKLIENENEIRIITKNKNKSKKNIQAPISIVKTTEVTSKKESKPKDLRTELKKLGIKDDVIDKMIAAGMPTI